jgi:hypothetical protein
MTDRQKLALLAIVEVVTDSIKELGSVPSGHLYAALMSHMTLDTYNTIIGVLTKQGKIKVQNHLITWIGN